MNASCCDFIKANPPRALLLAALLASALILGVALVSQYGFGLFPCELCILQRIPYAVIIVLAGMGAYSLRTQRRLMMVAALCAALFAVDAGIAAYHAGVELHIFPGPSGCTADNSKEQTLEEMRRAIMEAQLVPCDQPMVHVLGLSMAAWNAVAAALLAGGMAAALLRLRGKGGAA